MAKLPKLPIGIQTFDTIRKEGYLYVDKTKYLVDLIDNGKVYFLSRPRRFGKSLTVSTFDALFSGKRELFKGLCAEEFCSRPEYKTYPVIRLDMSSITTDMGPDALRTSLLYRIKDNADRLGVDTGAALPGDAFFSLMNDTARKYNTPAVVLIDEYDKPILDNIHDLEKAASARDILRNFYVRIKAADASLRFVFLTGISKFTKTGVFSALNSLEDISMDKPYSTMLGYTDTELLSNFDSYIDEVAADKKESKAAIIEQLQNYYDGFSFDGENRLYNPFSTLNFFKKKEFRNYWFESATPSALVEYVKRHDLEVESFRGLEVPENFTSMTEIEHASPESFLFQSGYLSVREKRERKLILDYPNMEVLSSVADLFLWGKAEAAGIGVAPVDLEEYLARGDAEGLVKVYNALLASIPYDIYEREERKYARDKKESYAPAPFAESFYHALLYTLLWSSRVNTIAENHSYWGRSDIEAEKNGYHFVIELKVTECEEAAKASAGEAMRQIREKGYADKYAETGVVMIALAVDGEKRRVAEYVIERL